MSNKRKLIMPTDVEDVAVNAGIVADPDTYVLNQAEFEQLKRVGRLPSQSPKVSATMRYDVDIIEAFKAGGDGWQTRMNHALRDWLKTHQI